MKWDWSLSLAEWKNMNLAPTFWFGGFKLLLHCIIWVPFAKGTLLKWKGPLIPFILAKQFHVLVWNIFITCHTNLFYDLRYIMANVLQNLITDFGQKKLNRNSHYAMRSLWNIWLQIKTWKSKLPLFLPCCGLLEFSFLK